MTVYKVGLFRDTVQTALRCLYKTERSHQQSDVRQSAVTKSGSSQRLSSNCSGDGDSSDRAASAADGIVSLSMSVRLSMPAGGRPTSRRENAAHAVAAYDGRLERSRRRTPTLIRTHCVDCISRARFYTVSLGTKARVGERFGILLSSVCFAQLPSCRHNGAERRVPEVDRRLRRRCRRKAEVAGNGVGMTSSVIDVTSLACTAVALAVLLLASLSQRHLAANAASRSSLSFPWRIPIGKNVESQFNIECYDLYIKAKANLA